MLNQSLYYTIQYLESNTKSKDAVTTALGSRCRKKLLGSLKVNINKYQVYQFMYRLYYNLLPASLS